ncbi:MAG: type I methionyl aminopeptidase [Deltaproteobacteria bacterium]|nr:type I methionyl aminopeptidase [Deltaproteobacteria bacterium]
MVILKSEEEIEQIRQSNMIVAEILAGLAELVKPGVRTIDLDAYAEEGARRKGAVPAFKGYRGYPFSLCTSMNEEVVHGMPSDRELKEGDIISLDFGIFYKGFYGDAALTAAVGQISANAARLIAVTRESLAAAIKNVRPGNRIGDVSSAVQRCVETAGYSVVRDFVGHGIGRELHEEPPVPNYGRKGRGIELKEGMVLAIEPMVNEGSYEVKVKEDEWTVVTRDGKLSAHFEHTVAVTSRGAIVLSAVDGN